MVREGMKCVIYVRVSTEMQVEGFSLDAQRNVLKKYAEREGMIVKNIYEDAGKSGKSIEGRPAFTQMLEDIKDGLSIDYILVYKLSRFGRNAADILNSIEFIQSYDINLIATEEGIDSSQTSGKLLISVLSAVSEIERENILEQTMNGRKEKARQGEWNGGFAPYGYKLVDGKLFIEEDEACVIRQIFDLFANKNKGAYEIASTLNIDGVGKIVRQNGTLPFWSAGTVKRIIDNPIYKGKIAFGRRTKKKVKGTKNQYQMVTTSDFIESDGKHEAIIDEDVWEKAHAIRLKNKTDRGGNPFAAKNVLSGLLRCPKCGGKLFVKYYKRNSEGKTEYFEYGCYNTRTDRGYSCDNLKRVVGFEIENYIVSLIMELISTNEFSNMVMNKISSPVDTKKLEEKLENYKAELSDAITNRDRLEEDIDNLSARDSNYEKTRKRYNERLNKIYDLIDSLEEHISDLSLKISGIKSKDITPEKVLKCLENFDTIFDLMNREEQRQLMGLIIKNINFDDSTGKISTIDFKFPVQVNVDPRKKEQTQYIEVDYAVKDSPVFLKQHELLVIPNGDKKPINRLIRSHTYNRKQATYKQIKDYVLEKFKFKVSTEYIAYVKRLHCIDMQVSRTKEESKHNIPPKEKLEAIEAALKFYNMI